MSSTPAAAIRLVASVDEIADIRDGEILVCGSTSPAWAPIFSKIKAAVTDIGDLTAYATAAVQAGQGNVLDASHVIFPNGAITLVLILAESHLSIHTWPEENLIAIDLFSCGAIDGEAVIADLVRSLELENVTVRPVQRGIRAQSRAVPEQ